MKYLKTYESTKSHDFLLEAIIYQKSGVFDLIETFNGNIDFTDDENFMDRKMTPLMYAIQYEREEILEKLVEKGANVNHQDINGMTPVMLAAEVNNWSMIVYLLEDAHADLYIHDNDFNFLPDYLEEIKYEYFKEDYPKEYEELKKLREIKINAKKFNI